MTVKIVDPCWLGGTSAGRLALKRGDGGNLPRLAFDAKIERFPGVFRLSSRVAHEKNRGNSLVLLLAVKVTP